MTLEDVTAIRLDTKSCNPEKILNKAIRIADKLEISTIVNVNGIDCLCCPGDILTDKLKAYQRIENLDIEFRGKLRNTTEDMLMDRDGDKV